MTDLGDRYRLEGSIGRGASGEVFRALDLRLDRVVAVKMLHPSVAANDDTRRRFRREATTLAQLRHPNIVQVLDFDEAAPIPYLVQEHCGGGTLVQRTIEAPLAWPEVAELGLAISRGLAHAHANGVTHRDLKPGNVLYGDDGELRVADFGLAEVLRQPAGDDITDDGSRVGSPEYWAPEQAAGLDVTERADMYALGCILYELATGTLPFEGSDRLEVGMRRMHEDPPLPTDFVADLPEEAEDLIMALLIRAPERRPRAEDVVRTLDDGAQTLPGRDRVETTRLPAAAGVAATMVAPPNEEPTPWAGGVGVRTGWLRLSALLIALGVILAGVGIASGTTIGRSGITPDLPLERVSAGAALAVTAGAAMLCLSLLLLALWAVRNRERARGRFGRFCLSIVSIVVAAAASAAVIWTANAAITIGVPTLWRAIS